VKFETRKLTEFFPLIASSLRHHVFRFPLIRVTPVFGSNAMNASNAAEFQKHRWTKNSCSDNAQLKHCSRRNRTHARSGASMNSALLDMENGRVPQPQKGP
jgi:hypothetical protein